VVLVFALAACSDGGGSAPPPSSPAPSASGSSLAVQGTWAARISSPRAAAFYFIVANDGGRKDRLVGAKSREAGSVGIFEQGAGSTDLVPVEAIEVPAGGSVSVQPGGFEVVLIDVTSPIVVGETLSVVLQFEHAGRVAVDAEVRPFVDPATLPKG